MLAFAETTHPPAETSGPCSWSLMQSWHGLGTGWALRLPGPWIVLGLCLPAGLAALAPCTAEVRAMVCVLMAESLPACLNLARRPAQDWFGEQTQGSVT